MGEASSAVQRVGCGLQICVEKSKCSPICFPQMMNTACDAGRRSADDFGPRLLFCNYQLVRQTRVGD